MGRKIAIVLGTRPEAVKMAPVIKAFQADPQGFDVQVVSTGQHREMLAQILSSFGIVPDLDLAVMQAGMSLAEMTAAMLQAMDRHILARRPDLLLVQGDTTTVLAAAMAAFYRQAPVGHVEAGLRSHDLQNPFPEEANRRLVSILATVHFAPTGQAARELKTEGLPPDRIVVTGNTVVDALRHIAAGLDPAKDQLQALAQDRRTVLVTAHRRESWGRGLENICEAVLQIAESHPDVAVVFPVHANPAVKESVERILGRHPRISLLPPVPYLDFVRLMHRAALILTDSGGVQEEAPSFGVPVLILRDVTERSEAVACGHARLVGTDPVAVARAASEILARPAASGKSLAGSNPFGDGRAAERIVLASRRFLAGERPLLRSSETFVSTCAEAG